MSKLLAGKLGLPIKNVNDLVEQVVNLSQATTAARFIEDVMASVVDEKFSKKLKTSYNGLIDKFPKMQSDYFSYKKYKI